MSIFHIFDLSSFRNWSFYASHNKYFCHAGQKYSSREFVIVENVRQVCLLDLTADLGIKTNAKLTSVARETKVVFRAVITQTTAYLSTTRSHMFESENSSNWRNHFTHKHMAWIVWIKTLVVPKPNSHHFNTWLRMLLERLAVTD